MSADPVSDTRPAAPEGLSTPAVSAFTRERVERVMSVAVGIGCVALGIQAFFMSLGDPDTPPAWHVALVTVAFVPLVVMVVAFFAARAIAIFAWTFVICYVLVLVAWPYATAGTHPPADAQPWVYFLINVATVAAVLAMRMPFQIAFTIGVPLLYGAVRLIQLGAPPEAWVPVALDVSFALILGSVLLTLGWAFRAAASTVDERRIRAVDSYARAAAVTATERERVAVAALMHDSVLAALLAAERADSPREYDLAVSMAREALTRLANTDRDVGEGSDSPVRVEAIAAGLPSVLADHGLDDRSVRAQIDVGAPEVPGRVARGLVLAATQAISNAVEHVNAVGLEVSVVAQAFPGEVTVTVSDSGEGFDMEGVPLDRLGIRASILARVTAFGGTAHVESGAGGTVVTLRWRAVGR